MANHSDEEKRKQLDHIVDLLAQARGELKRLEDEACILQRATKSEEADLQTIGAILAGIVEETKALRSHVTLLNLGRRLSNPK